MAMRVAHRVGSDSHPFDSATQLVHPGLPLGHTSPRPSTRRGRSGSASPEEPPPVQGEAFLGRGAPTGAALPSVASHTVQKYRRNAPGPLHVPASGAMGREALMQWSDGASSEAAASPPWNTAHPAVPTGRRSFSGAPSPSTTQGAVLWGEEVEGGDRLLSALSLSPLPRSPAGGRRIKSALKSPSSSGRQEVLVVGPRSARRVHWCESVKVIRWSGDNQRTTPGRIVNKL